MPFITDEDGIERWIFTQPDDCDRLGRLRPTDLPDVACTGCGHPRGTDCGCSCTGPGTCGGGTDDIGPDPAGARMAETWRYGPRDMPLEDE